MATLREIKQRIKGIKSTQQITKAMKMVAAAKMRRAQERMFSARPYANKIKELVYHLLVSIENPQSLLLRERPIQRILFVVVTADRGLCGAFNSHIIKRTLSEFTQNKGQEISLVTVGKKGYDFFRKRDYSIAKNFGNVFADLQLVNAEEVTRFLMEEYISGRTDAVRVIFNEFKNVAQQRLVVQDLLPFKVSDANEEVHAQPRSIDYLYEPSVEALLEALLPRYIKVQVWRALLESFAAEQAARMMAMDNATENASELIQNLTLVFNKARQAAITKEILEIVGGAEALRSV
jgi:F-type H+-transporting ATPase subunit gamma